MLECEVAEGSDYEHVEGGRPPLRAVRGSLWIGATPEGLAKAVYARHPRVIQSAAFAFRVVLIAG